MNQKYFQRKNEENKNIEYLLIIIRDIQSSENIKLKIIF